MVDYRKLCIELFGTDNVAEIRRIYSGLTAENPRKAGRKRRFSEEDIIKMQEMYRQGSTYAEIATKFGTTKTTVHQYCQHRPQEGCTMRIFYMYKQKPCTLIDVDFRNERIFVTNLTEDPYLRAFGKTEHPTWEDFEYFLEDRSFPRDRGNAKDLLKSLGLTDYDPLQIIEKTQGRMAEDEMWMKFSYFPQKGTSNGHHPL